MIQRLTLEKPMKIPQQANAITAHAEPSQKLIHHNIHVMSQT